MTYRHRNRGARYRVSWCYPFDLGTDVIRTIVRRRGLTDATSYCKRRSDSDPSQRSVDGSRLPESARGWPVVKNAARFGTEKAQEPLQRVNRAGTHLLGL